MFVDEYQLSCGFMACMLSHKNCQTFLSGIFYNPGVCHDKQAFAKQKWFGVAIETK